MTGEDILSLFEVSADDDFTLKVWIGVVIVFIVSIVDGSMDVSVIFTSDFVSGLVASIFELDELVDSGSDDTCDLMFKAVVVIGVIVIDRTGSDIT